MADQESKSNDQNTTGQWAVWRVDDNGNVFLVRDNLPRTEAQCLVDEFTARGHKQTYWCERVTNEPTPPQILDAWVSMGSSGDRDRVMRAVDEIEHIVREMGRDLEYLQHPDQWDDFGLEHDDPLKFIQHHLANSNEASTIVARLANLRAILERAFPPNPGG